MVLTGQEIWAHADAAAKVGNGAAVNYLHNELERSNIVGRSRAHDMAFMMGACQVQVPLAKDFCAPMMQREHMDEIGIQTALMRNNQVSNVIKRVHEAAAVDFFDNAKRCRYDSTDQLDYNLKRGIGNNEQANGKRCCLDNDTGDIEMDVDLNLGQLFSQPVCEETQQQLRQQQQQQQQQQQEKHQQEIQEQYYLQESQSQLLAQIFQDQNNDYCTMGHGNFELNSHSHFEQKFPTINATKNAEFPETIDDVEYMYQTTHGGDFMRHLNCYPGEDL